MACEGEVIVQGDEGPVCGVAQVVDSHGVTVGHKEREEEEEQQEEEESDGEELKERCTWMACGWSELQVRAALSQVECDVNDQTKTLKTACRCAQFCMLRKSVCVASFMLMSTMVSPMLKVCLSLYTLLRSYLRSHLFVNCCIRRYSLYTPRR